MRPGVRLEPRQHRVPRASVCFSRVRYGSSTKRERGRYGPQAPCGGAGNLESVRTAACLQIERVQGERRLTAKQARRADDVVDPELEPVGVRRGRADHPLGPDQKGVAAARRTAQPADERLIWERRVVQCGATASTGHIARARVRPLRDLRDDDPRGAGRIGSTAGLHRSAGADEQRNESGTKNGYHELWLLEMVNSGFRRDRQIRAPWDRAPIASRTGAECRGAKGLRSRTT